VVGGQCGVGWANRQQLKEPLGLWRCLPSDRAGHRAAPWSCRARAMSWARAAAHALHWPSCRASHGPCQKAVPPDHGPFGNLY
jgi:hypothetical protein